MANVFLTVVVPVFGNILGAIMLLSPVKAVLEVRRRGDIGDINPVPYPMTALNCLAWVCYGIVISNGFILPANILGLVAGVVFTLVTLPYVRPQKMQDIITGMLTFFTLHFCILGTITSLAHLSPKAAKTMWGLNAVLILFGYYSAPLSSLWTVIRTRNATSLYAPLAVAAICNGSLWTIYGLVLGDINVWLPNLFGAIIGVLQVGLRLRYGARSEPKLPSTHQYPELGTPDRRRASSSGLLEGAVPSHAAASHVVVLGAHGDRPSTVATVALGGSGSSPGIDGPGGKPGSGTL